MAKQEHFRITVENWLSTKRFIDVNFSERTFFNLKSG